MPPSLKQVVEQEVIRDGDSIIAAQTDTEVKDVAAQIAERTALKRPEEDLFSYRAVIVILGIVIIVVVATYATYALTPDEKDQAAVLRELPDALISLGSAAVGALAGLLAPNPRRA